MTSVRLFAAAAEAAGVDHTDVDAASVAQVRASLAERYGDDFARVLRQCAIVVGGERADDDRRVDGEVVDVLPPFAGG